MAGLDIWRPLMESLQAHREGTRRTRETNDLGRQSR